MTDLSCKNKVCRRNTMIDRLRRYDKAADLWYKAAAYFLRHL